MTARPPHGRRARRWTVCATFLMLGLAVVSCSEDGPAGDLGDRIDAGTDGDQTAQPDGTAPLETAPPETTPPETTPPETTPPETTPPETTPPDQGAEADQETERNWGLVALGLALIALIIGAVALGARSHRSDPTPAGVSPAQSRRRELLGTAQWVHDQFSLEILAAAPEAAAQRLATERWRLDELAIGCNQLAAEPDGQLWRRLGYVVTSLTSSLGTATELRGQDPVDDTLVREATAVVNRQRTELAQLLELGWQHT